MTSWWRNKKVSTVRFTVLITVKKDRPYTNTGHDNDQQNMIYIAVSPSVCLSVRPSISPSVRPSVCLSHITYTRSAVCTFHWHTPLCSTWTQWLCDQLTPCPRPHTVYWLPVRVSHDRPEQNSWRQKKEEKANSSLCTKWGRIVEWTYSSAHSWPQLSVEPQAERFGKTVLLALPIFGKAGAVKTMGRTCGMLHFAGVDHLEDLCINWSIMLTSRALGCGVDSSGSGCCLTDWSSCHFNEHAVLEGGGGELFHKYVYMWILSLLDRASSS